MSAEKPWLPNTGAMPDLPRGKRVIVELRRGDVCGEQPLSATSPAGWAVETTRWTIDGSPFDVRRYRVL